MTPPSAERRRMLLAELGVSEDDLPVVVWRHGGMLRNPTDDEVLAAVESGS